MSNTGFKLTYSLLPCRTVKRNLRVCVIVNDTGRRFQNRCREYPVFIKSINIVWFPHWNKRQLIRQTAHHVRSKHYTLTLIFKYVLQLSDDVTVVAIEWMDKKTKENLSHMLATMHMVIRQQDGQEVGAGQYNHLTNLTFEKFVERFISLANERYKHIDETHNSMQFMMEQIQIENAMANRLRKELEHERVVLEERKRGTVRILSQIGQDTAITEQQIRIVKTQMNKIQRLKQVPRIIICF